MTSPNNVANFDAGAANGPHPDILKFFVRARASWYSVLVPRVICIGTHQNEPENLVFPRERNFMCIQNAYIFFLKTPCIDESLMQLFKVKDYFSFVRTLFLTSGTSLSV